MPKGESHFDRESDAWKVMGCELLIGSSALVFARDTTLHVSAMRRVHCRMRGLWPDLALTGGILLIIGVATIRPSLAAAV